MNYITREPEIDATLAALRRNGMILEFVRDQTPEICLTAVRSYPVALQFVQEQTPEICIAALQIYGLGIVYVREQTPEICLAAVQQDGEALEYVHVQTPEICLAAVQDCGLALEFVEEQTPEICLAAIQQNPDAQRYIRIELNIQELNPTSFEELPNTVDMTDVVDPVTFEGPTDGTVCAFYVRDERWIFLATLESCNCLIRSRVLNCTSTQITDPQRRIVVPVSEIRWVRLGGFRNL